MTRAPKNKQDQIQKTKLKPGENYTEGAPAKPITVVTEAQGEAGPQEGAPEPELEAQEVQKQDPDTSGWKTYAPGRDNEAKKEDNDSVIIRKPTMCINMCHTPPP